MRDPFPSMSAALLTQRAARQIIGQARLKRLMRASWLKPIERNGRSVLFDPRDIRAALRRLELERCPPDRIEIAKVRASEVRNGHAYVKKGRPQPTPLDAIELDFSGFIL